MNTTDKGLLTPYNCAVVFIDCHAQSVGEIGYTECQILLNNLLLLAKAAKIFGVPTLFTTVQSGEFTGEVTPQLVALFPDMVPIVRTSINAWDSPAFVSAIKKTERKNVVVAALWSETSLVFPALQMLEEGYGIYAVEDASGGASRGARDAAIRRIEQAGAVSLTALQVLLEFQRDWSRKEHEAEVRMVVKEHGGPIGPGLVYAVSSALRNQS